MDLADACIQSDLQYIQAIHFCQYVCFLGIEPTTFCAANAMHYHWATGTLIHSKCENTWSTHNTANICSLNILIKPRGCSLIFGLVLHQTCSPNVNFHTQYNAIFLCVILCCWSLLSVCVWMEVKVWSCIKCNTITVQTTRNDLTVFAI